MADQNTTTQATLVETPAAPQVRVFKTGGTEIAESDATAGKSNEAVRNILKDSFPEVATATIRETTDSKGRKIVEFVAKEGRKG